MTVRELYEKTKNTEDLGADREIKFLHRLTNEQCEEHPLELTGIYPEAVVVEIAD